MSKYNLKDLLIEGMSDAEFKDAGEASRLEKHPEGDKIAKIKAMMAKEKSMKENYQMDGEVYDRIDGVIHNGLKRKFLFAFEDLYDDMVESGDEFDKEDVLDYLAICLDKHSRGMNEGAKYYEDDNRKDSPVEKETEKMRMKESKTLEDLAKRLGISVEDLEARVNKFQSAERGAINTGSRLSVAESSVDEREFDFFTAILDGRYKEEDIEDYLKSDDYQAAQDEFKLDDTYTSDWVQEFANYFDSRMDESNAYDADEDTDAMIAQMKKDGKSADDFIDEGLKEHFQRFLKDYQ